MRHILSGHSRIVAAYSIVNSLQIILAILLYFNEIFLQYFSTISVVFEKAFVLARPLRILKYVLSG